MASPIGMTENEKCKNAIKMVRDAMKKLDYTDDDKEIRTYMGDSYSYALDMRKKYLDRKITLLVQGSYANKTNISSESDIDVAVILESTFTTKYRPGVMRENYGFSAGTFTAANLKDEVFDALNSHFQHTGVSRHDKSIKVCGNTYRVDADVVPAYRYRNYENDYSNNPNNYFGGIEIIPDSGGSIVNYPEQHIKNGILKNKQTNYIFKKCVRIIKNMRELMKEEKYFSSSEISSFGLESLLWNVADDSFLKHQYVLRYAFDEIIAFLRNDFNGFGRYTEANGIKPLFTDEAQKIEYKRFIENLCSFYEYDL